MQKLCSCKIIVNVDCKGVKLAHRGFVTARRPCLVTKMMVDDNGTNLISMHHEVIMLGSYIF